MKRAYPPIIVEETYNTSLKSVWAAITEAAQMQIWYFEQIESFLPNEGFSTEFLVENEGRKFTHLWKIIEVKVNHKIKYQWRYKEYPGDSVVTFELVEVGDKVKLKLTAEVIENFPDDIPEFKRESGVEGWNYLIKKSLKAFLEK